MKLSAFFVASILFIELFAGSVSAKAIPITNPDQSSSQTQQASPDAASYQAIIQLNEDSIDATGPSTLVKEHRIVKLLSPDAVQRYARALEFTYVTPTQQWTIEDVKVTTPDGKVTDLPLTDEKVISPLEKFPPYNNLKFLFLPLKNLQPGSILEYTATYSEQSWIPGEYWELLYLQDQDPITKEVVSLTEKTGASAQVEELHGSLPSAQTSNGTGSVTRTWEWDNVEPYPDLASELSVPPPADIAPQLIISSLDGWDKVGRGVETAYLSPATPGDLDSVISKYLKTATTSDDKLRLTYAFVDQAIRSLPEKIGGDFGKIPHPLDYDVMVQQGLGDTRDKAALLAALLKKEGFDPELALISTSANGAVPEDIPYPGAFNRLLVRVRSAGNIFWFDPYVENCPFGYLPPEDQGRRALILDTGEFMDTPILPAADNSREVDVKARVLADGGLVANLDMTANGSDSIAMRTLLRSVAPDQRNQLIGALAGQIAESPKVDQVTLSSVDDLDHPLAIGVQFEAASYATVAGDLTFLSMPFNVSTDLQAILAENGARQYPFLLGSTTREVKHLDLTIPPGYKLRFLPKGIKISNPIGSYEAHFSETGNKLVFDSTFVLDKISIEPAEWQDLKSLVSDKVKTEGEKIVFEKKKKIQAMR